MTALQPERVTVEDLDEKSAEDRAGRGEPDATRSVAMTAGGLR